MILSEKITELRRKSGLSQEQFGEKIGVSRQAVSKWEMAQSIPDITKIMAMADFFEVPVDFLLKDEYDLPFPDSRSVSMINTVRNQDVLSMEEAQDYFHDVRTCAKRTVIAILLFFLSPAAGIFLSLQEDERLGMLGAVIQVIVLAAAALTVIPAFLRLRKYQCISSSGKEPAYGVRGTAEEYRKDFEHTHLTGIVTGAGLMICSVIPMMVCAVFTEKDAVIAGCGLLMVLMFASGISMMVYVMMIQRSYTNVIRMK